MKKITIAAAAFLLLFGVKHSNAQTKSFEFETDPTSFFTNGYNFNFGYSIPHWAIRLVPYKTELPEFIHGNKDFKQNMLGVAFDLDYFFKENNNGLFVGPVVIYSKDEIENSYKQKINNDQLLAGLRIGYRIMPFKKQRENLNGFYFTPFIAPFYSSANDVAFTNGNSFEYKQFQFWGGIHLGYRINTRYNSSNE
jgi:hypothetical protein